jgi:undecaprenyl-diphosphatase
LCCGFLAALIFGIIACKWMIKLVSNGKLIYFAYYCIILGAVVITYSVLK